MPKNPKIFPITITNPVVEDYCLSHSFKIPKELMEIESYTKKNILAHRMLSNHIQAHFLITLSYLMRPKKVLEIGTFTGYSAICLAQGLTNDGKIISIEKHPEFVSIAQNFFEKYNYKNIQVIHSDGLEFVKQHKDLYDLIYLDADKERYKEYLIHLLPLLEEKGVMIIDNTLWKGLVTEAAKEPVTRKIQEFNEFLKTLENQIFYSLMPIRDGITLILKK
ncbi:MAG: O-methyltransferase [Bacteroidia bacterium]|nr:MAG: O-methyltransferase [Bacteroidia bacterium]